MIGFYTVLYEVSNSAGDVVKLPIDIEIYEPYNNEVTLNLDRYLVYYTGETIDYKSFLKSIQRGNLEYPFEGVTLVGTQLPEEETTEEMVTEEETEGETEEELPNTVSKNLVRVDAQVDTNTPGVYPVYYYFEQGYGNYTSEAKEVLYVVVE